jgi:hypothetical protein
MNAWVQTTQKDFDATVREVHLNITNNFDGEIGLKTFYDIKALTSYYDNAAKPTPMYRTWNHIIDHWSPEKSDNTLGTDENRWFVVESGTIRKNEKILGIINKDRNLNVEVWNGTTWGSVYEFGKVTIHEDYRCFDIAYESWSGRAIIAYFNTSSTVNNLYPKYRIWNGTNLSIEFDAQQVGTNDIYWVELASNPDTNEIIMVTLDSGANIYAQVWNGTGWGNVKQIEGAGLEVAATTNYPCFDVAYESRSGVGFIAWGDDNDELRCRRWTGNWSESESGWAIATDEPRFIKLAADPSSNNIAAGYLDSGQSVVVRIWDGITWGSSQLVTGSTDRNDRRGFDIAWEVKSNKEGLIVYETNANMAKYRTINDKIISTEYSVGYTGNGKTNWIILESDLQSDDIMLEYVDSQNDIITGYWNGYNWENWDTIELDSRPTNAQRFDLAITDASGYFISTPFNKSINSPWGRIYWNASIPPGTDILFKTRTSWNGVTWSAWSDWCQNGDTILSPGRPWIQYLAWFETRNVTLRPTLYDVAIVLNRPDITLIGSNGDQFGWAISNAGDLNNDGFDDIIIGAPYNDSLDGSQLDAGAVYIFYGNYSLTNKTIAEADKITYGENSTGHFGWSVSFADNVDGYDMIDILVGAADFDNGTNPNTGKSYIYTTGGVIPEFHLIILPVLIMLMIIMGSKKSNKSIKSKKYKRKGVII